MTSEACTSCHKAKAPLTCIGCKEALCKACATFVDLENTFSFLPAMPNDVEGGSYCVLCYESKAQPAVEAYDEQMEKAKNISVYMKNQGKEVTSLRRAQVPVTVTDCEDRDETLLRLAFLTVERGYDTLISVDLVPKKIRTGTYQKSAWQGTGTPAEKRRRK